MYFIVAGGDDKRILLWNVEKSLDAVGCPSLHQDPNKAQADNVGANPVILKGEHHSNVFCLSFDNAGSKIFSGGNGQVMFYGLFV